MQCVKGERKRQDKGDGKGGGGMGKLKAKDRQWEGKPGIRAWRVRNRWQKEGNQGSRKNEKNRREQREWEGNMVKGLVWKEIWKGNPGQGRWKLKLISCEESLVHGEKAQMLGLFTNDANFFQEKDSQLSWNWSLSKETYVYNMAWKCLKCTCGNVKIQNFPGGGPPNPPSRRGLTPSHTLPECAFSTYCMLRMQTSSIAFSQTWQVCRWQVFCYFEYRDSYFSVVLSIECIFQY